MGIHTRALSAAGLLILAVAAHSYAEGLGGAPRPNGLSDYAKELESRGGLTPATGGSKRTVDTRVISLTTPSPEPSRPTGSAAPNRRGLANALDDRRTTSTLYTPTTPPTPTTGSTYVPPPAEDDPCGSHGSGMRADDRTAEREAARLRAERDAARQQMQRDAELLTGVLAAHGDDTNGLQRTEDLSTAHSLMLSRVEAGGDLSALAAEDLDRPAAIGAKLTLEDADRLGFDTERLAAAIETHEADPSDANRRRMDKSWSEVEEQVSDLGRRLEEAGGDHLAGVPFEDLTSSDIREVLDRIKNDPELSNRIDDALDYAREAIDLLRQLEDARRKSNSWWRNREYWLERVREIEQQLRDLIAEYAEEIGDDLLVIGQSGFNDDMLQITDGGYGLYGAVQAYRAKYYQFNDGLQPTYDEFLVIPGGLFTRAATRATVCKAGTWTATRATAKSVRDKLTRYLLNPAHPKGGPKAKWFEEALGFTKDNLGQLARQIVFDPKKAVQTAVTQHGTKFNQTILIRGANGKQIEVTFAFIRNNDGVVRLVTGIPTKLR